MNLLLRLLLLLATGSVTLMISMFMIVAVYQGIQQRVKGESPNTLYEANEMLSENSIELQLRYLKLQADNGRLEEATKHLEWLLNNLQDASPNQRELITHWERFLCDNLLSHAKQQYRKADRRYLNDALYPLSSIPRPANCYEDTQQRIQSWQSECSHNAQLFQAAEDLRRRGYLREAQQQTLQISSHPYWQLKANSFVQNLYAPYHDEDVCKL